jgi:hypothetical protein
MNASSLRLGLLLGLLTLPLAAQTNNPRPLPREDFSDFRPTAGTRELSFGGSGGSNRRMNDSFGGATASYGVFLTDTWQGLVRQSLNYSNPSGASRTWNGSTRLAADYHFPTDARVRPFLGANFGRIYGSSLRDTWSAGLEGGAKFYVQSRTFVYALAEYNWLFRKTRDLDNNFGSGQLYWTVGVGFNF